MLLAPVTTQERNSACRISLIVGYVVMVLAPLTLSPSGHVFFGAIAAALALVPLVLGPARYRVLAAFPLVIGAAVAVDSYDQFRKQIDHYRIRAELAEVVNLGSAIAVALDRHGLGARSLPNSVDELGVLVPREKVANVRIESEDQFVITLYPSRVTDKELLFVASNVDGARTWKCISRGLDPGSRPAACREDIDLSIRMDRK